MQFHPPPAGHQPSHSYSTQVVTPNGGVASHPNLLPCSQPEPGRRTGRPSQKSSVMQNRPPVIFACQYLHHPLS
ncbi:MAG: hypothetical protein ACK559_14095, partial [bacterium]